MTVQVLNKDGTSSSVSGFNWHPETDRGPASLWVTKDALERHYKEVNAIRREYGNGERDLTDVPGLIDCASAPFEIYLDCEDRQPWKHAGLLVKTILYGGSDDFWNKRA